MEQYSNLIDHIKEILDWVEIFNQQGRLPDELKEEIKELCFDYIIETLQTNFK